MKDTMNVSKQSYPNHTALEDAPDWPIKLVSITSFRDP